MKKYLPYANYLAAAVGIAGALLRQSLLVVGPNSQGLYPAGHPGWIGYLVVMILGVATIYLLSRQGSKNCPWEGNFSASIFPVMGNVLAAVGIGMCALPLLTQSQTLSLLCGGLGIAAASALLVIAVQQFRRQTPPALLYLLPCLFFGLQLLLLSKSSSTETQPLLYLPQVLALAASSLASYELTAFGAELGNRPRSLFWSLSAAALCLAAVPGANYSFALLGLWHLMSHCTFTEPATPINPTESIEETNETDA